MSGHSSVVTAAILAMSLGFAGCGSGALDGALPRDSFVANPDNPAAVTSAVQSPAQMQPGDILQLTAVGGVPQRIDLTGTPASAAFMLAVVNMASGGDVAQVMLQGDASAPVMTKALPAPLPVDAASDAIAMNLAPEVPANAGESALQEAFDEYLRGVERVIAPDQLQPVSAPSVGKAARSAALSLGETKAFRVVSSLSSISQFREVQGVLRCIGEQVLIYVDAEVDGAAGADLTRDDVLKLCDQYNAVAAAEFAMIGEPSDLDGNGRVDVLLTPAVNRLGALGGGIITGFFFAADLQPRSGAVPVSNEGEVLYLLVPDAGGRFGVPIGRDIALRNLLPAVFPHELQHAISYNQHVMLGSGIPEAYWLNEGIAHLMEDILGVGQENPSRYALYLQQPGNYSLTPAGSPGLVARGGIFLMLRYLYEQRGSTAQFVRDLLQSDLTGIDNLEAAVGGAQGDFDQFPEFLMRFGATLMLNASGLTTDSRYQFARRDWAPATPHFSGVCTQCDADDGRGTVVSAPQAAALQANAGASLQPSTFRFYHLAGGQAKLSVQGNADAQIGVVLVRTQ